MNLQESIRRIVKEVRVPRNERVELYKDNNIIVVVPLTHRALKKYANQCQWCINSDLDEWEDHHKGKHAVIIQRNPKKPKMGITGHPTASEIFFLAKWDNGQSDFDDICQILDYEFRNDRTMADYYTTISNDINNFGTNIVYYSPENGVYDQEDNFLWNFNYEISDIPNVTPEVIKIMDNYLQEEEEMNLQESIRRILKEEDYSPAGKEITPNKIVIHKSNPKVRDKISNEGLKARAGECYKIYAGYGEKCIPAIFATNSTNKRAWFDSTYDDDIWAINTEMIPDVKWYKDRHFESTKKHIVTFDNIPPEAIELMREGTGNDEFIVESIKRILREEVTKDKNLYGEKLKPCSRNPTTGFYRDGYCKTGDDDTGSHTVCAKVTEEFLEFTNSMGNNLDMLEPGDKWCLCAKRWEEANKEGVAPEMIKSSTNIKTLDIINSVEQELDEYARTLKNARQQGVGLRFPKSAIKSNPTRFRPYNR
jgi:hypothetical protein